MFKKLRMFLAFLAVANSQIGNLKTLIKTFEDALDDKKLTLAEASEILLQIIHILRNLFPVLRKR